MVSLSITTREVDGVSIVTLSGRIVFGDGSNALRSTVKNLIAEGKQKIVLNMSSIEYIDSAGLGMLVAAHISMKAYGALCLCGLGDKSQELLQLTRLSTVFQVRSTEAGAIVSFSKPTLIATQTASNA
jgi:anti-sigma B factor antagonist